MTSVLFFELFPAFMTIVSLAAGVALFVVNRRMQASGEDERPRSSSRPVRDTDSPREHVVATRPAMRGDAI